MSEIHEIYNFIQITENLATSGQPTIEQFKAIQEAGYDVIINLATGKTKNDLPNEGEIVSALNLAYHNIPVEWENPRSQDLEEFFAVMANYDDKKVYVHCIANMRVTAFTMLYRVIKQNIPLAEAQAIMYQIWHPEEKYPKWHTLIQKTFSQYEIEDA